MPIHFLEDMRHLLRIYAVAGVLACLYSAPSFALLSPVPAIELPPPQVTPVIAVELPPPNVRPVAAIELKPVPVIEAPYGTETLKYALLAANAQNDVSLPPPEESPPPRYKPVIHPRGSTAADFNPAVY